MNSILQLQICFFCFQGVFLISIRNVTADETRLETLEQSVEILQSKVQNLTRVLGVISNRLPPKKNNVVFYARLNSTITLNTYSIVKFNDVVINDGNHYNYGDGVFVAPVSGVYEFSWTTMTDSSDTVQTELRVENSVKDQLFLQLGGSSGIIPAARVTVCKVRKGDHVWIQTGSATSHNYIRGHYSYSSFMGLLLYES